MKKEIQSLLSKFKEKQQNSKIRKNIAVILSCVVALVTLYSLMLPAKTLNTDGEYRLYLKDKYLNDPYSWKVENEYQTLFDLKLHYVDTDGNIIDGKNITIDIGETYSNDIFSFGSVPLKEDGTNGKNIISENEIDTFTVETGKYVYDHVEVYINDSWQTLTKGNYILCHNATSEVEPTEKDYGWQGNYITSDGNINYPINDKVEYKLVYSYVENELEETTTENIDDTKTIDENNNTNDTKELNETTNTNNTTQNTTSEKSSKKVMMKSPKAITGSLSKDNSVASLGKESGIKFGLYNYTGGNNETGINANGLYKYFSFRDSSVTSPASYMNPDTDADGFGEKRAKVKSMLDKNGNPVFDCRGYCTNASLGYLFGSSTNAKGTNTEGVTSYSPKNTLLQKETIDGVDYYYYESKKNAVDYDATNQEFIVRNYKERGYTLSTYTNESDRYEFLPFNTKTEASSPTNNYDYAEKEIDHWYGMTMKFDFYMPKDGKINGKDMIFEFSGDDDVWVFIDDVLVLDLGGTHGSVDGTINFRTGEVKSFLNWDVPAGKDPTGPSYSETIKKMFNKDGVTVTPEYNSTGETFADYSKHTLKFFYLERGAAVANCSIRFNIPVLPAGSLSVQKQFDGVEKYADNYEFTIYDANNQPVPNATYTIGEVEHTTTSEGKFTLKNNEVAVFVSKSTNDDLENESTILVDGKNYLITKNKYYVKETNTGENAIHTACQLNEKDCSKSYTEDELNSNQNLKLQAKVTLSPESKHEAIFTNKTKTYNIVIKKEATNTDPDELFDFKVSLKDENNKSVDISKLELSFPNGYKIDSKDNGIVTFKIKSTESITIKNISIKTKVTLQEIDHDGYHVSIKSIVDGKEVPLVENDSYTIEQLTDNKTIKVYNTPGVMLPETGGPGITMYLVIGLSLIIISLKYGYSYFRNLEEGGE